MMFRYWLSILSAILSAILIVACDDNQSTPEPQNKGTDTAIYLQNNGISDTNFINCILDSYPGLTEYTIDTVADLYCTGEIYSVEGIGVFSNLENLELTGNHIARIDVTPLRRLKSIKVANDDSTLEISTGTDNIIESVVLENLPIKMITLSDYPNLKSLTLTSLSLNALEMNSNASIDQIIISKSQLPGLILAFLDVRKFTIADSTTPNILFSNLSFVEYLSSVNSNIDQLVLSDIEFTKVIDFSSSSINTLTIGNIKYVQMLDFSNNNIATVNLDKASYIGGISFGANPLLPATQAYLDTLTELNISY